MKRTRNLSIRSIIARRKWVAGFLILLPMWSALPSLGCPCVEPGIVLYVDPLASTAHLDQEITVRVRAASDADWTGGEYQPDCVYQADDVDVYIYKDNVLYEGPIRKQSGQDIVRYISFDTTGSHQIRVEAADVGPTVEHPNLYDDPVTPYREFNITVEFDPNDEVIDRPLPVNNLNNVENRSNIRWANPDSTKVYGDDFTITAGTASIKKVRAWIVPDVPVAPTYNFGDYYQSITLYGGADNGTPLQEIMTGSISEGQDSPSGGSITVTKVAYAPGPNYKAADGTEKQIWQVEFSGITNWTAQQNVKQIFAVYAAPRVDRYCFVHASNDDPSYYTSSWNPLGDEKVRLINTTNRSVLLDPVDGTLWFGQGSDINVQIYAESP